MHVSAERVEVERVLRIQRAIKERKSGNSSSGQYSVGQQVDMAGIVSCRYLHYSLLGSEVCGTSELGLFWLVGVYVDVCGWMSWAFGRLGCDVTSSHCFLRGFLTVQRLGGAISSYDEEEL